MLIDSSRKYASNIYMHAPEIRTIMGIGSQDENIAALCCACANWRQCTCSLAMTVPLWTKLTGCNVCIE